MNPSRRLTVFAFAFALCALLSACGGGPDAEAEAVVTPPTQPPARPLQEFEGTWLPRPGSATCTASFPYDTPSFYRFRQAVVTSADHQLQAQVMIDVYQDAGCTTKLGLLQERFTMDALATQSGGRTDVIKGTPVFVDAVSDADGGSGVVLTTAPDGAASGLLGQKLLMDRDGDRLYVTRSVNCPALDCNGYPVFILPEDYLVN